MNSQLLADSASCLRILRRNVWVGCVSYRHLENDDCPNYLHIDELMLLLTCALRIGILPGQQFVSDVLKLLQPVLRRLEGTIQLLRAWNLLEAVGSHFELSVQDQSAELLKRLLRTNHGWGIVPGDVPRVPTTSLVVSALLRDATTLDADDIEVVSRCMTWVVSEWEKDFYPDSDGLPFKAGHFVHAYAKLRMITGFDPVPTLFTDTLESLVRSQLPNGAWPHVLRRAPDQVRLDLASELHTAFVLSDLLSLAGMAVDGDASVIARAIERAAFYLISSLSPSGYWKGQDGYQTYLTLCAGTSALHRLSIEEKQQWVR